MTGRHESTKDGHLEGLNQFTYAWWARGKRGQKDSEQCIVGGTKHEQVHERHTCEWPRCTNSKRHGQGCGTRMPLTVMAFRVRTFAPALWKYNSQHPSLASRPRNHDPCYFACTRRASHTDHVELAQEETIRTSVDRRTRRALDVL